MILENSESINSMVITDPDHSKGKMQIAGFKFRLYFGAGLIKINSGIILNKKQTALRTWAIIFIYKQYGTHTVLSDTALST